MTTAQLKTNEAIYKKAVVVGGIILLIIGLIFPAFTEDLWFNIIIGIRRQRSSDTCFSIHEQSLFYTKHHFVHGNHACYISYRTEKKTPTL